MVRENARKGDGGMERPDFLEGGEPARLIPVAADGSREARAASILLATLLGVPPFAKLMLGLLGQRLRAYVVALPRLKREEGGLSARTGQ